MMRYVYKKISKGYTLQRSLTINKQDVFVSVYFIPEFVELQKHTVAAASSLSFMSLFSNIIIKLS